MPNVNKRILSVPMVYTKKVTESIKDDPEVINLGRGESEFQPPQLVRNALCRIVNEGEKWMKYGKTNGSKNLREAISRKYKREANLEIDPDWVLVTQGGTNALYLAFLGITNPGDEILIPDPCYVHYEPAICHSLREIKGIRLPLPPENHFFPSSSLLDSYKNPQTKAFIMTSPLNPTGTIYNRSEIEEMVSWAKENDIFLIHDENHEKECYDNNVHYPVSIFDHEFKNTILINSFSRLGMGGWRLGWIVANPKVIEAASMGLLYVNMSCNSFVQETGAYVLDHYDELGFSNYFNHYREKRDIMVKKLNCLNQVSCSLPQGTCYAFPNIRELYNNNKEKILYLVRKKIKNNSTEEEKLWLENSVSFAIHKFFLLFAKVGVIPGISYGKSGDDFVRMSFSVKQEEVVESMNRLEKIYDLL